MDTERLKALKSDLEQLKRLAQQEDETGKASFEQLNLEDSLGNYRDILGELIDAHTALELYQSWFDDMRMWK